MAKTIKKSQQGALIIGVIVVVTIVAIASAYYSDSVDHIQATVHGVLDQFGLWAPVLYVIAYTLIGLTGFSVTVLSLVALGIFDSVTAFLVIIIGASLSATTAFLIARSSKYHLLSTQKHSGSYNKLITQLMAKIEQNVTDKPFWSVFILRLARPPYIAFSYAAGLVPRLEPWPFVAATIISNIISALVYVLVGAVILAYLAGATIIFLVGLGAYYLWQNIHK